MQQHTLKIGMIAAAALFIAVDAVQAVPGWASSTHRRNPFAQINNLSDADAAINSGIILGSGVAGAVNYFEPGGGGGAGNFGGDIEPFGLSGGADDDFAVLSQGYLTLTQAGNYQFRNNTDDGSRLRLDLNGDNIFGAGEDIIIDNVLSGPHNADSAILALGPGTYKIQHTWYERGGGAEGDLGVSFNSSGFVLVGNQSQAAFTNFGASVTTALPEPATLSLLALGGLGLLRRRRQA